MKLIKMLFDDVDSDKLSRIEKAIETTGTILFIVVCLLVAGFSIYIAIR